MGSVLEGRAGSVSWDLVNGATKLTDFLTSTHQGLIRKEHEFMWKYGGRWLYSKFFDADLAEQKLNKYWFGSQSLGSDQSNNGDRLKNAMDTELAVNKGADIVSKLTQAPIIGDLIQKGKSTIATAINQNMGDMIDIGVDIADRMQIG